MALGQQSFRPGAGHIREFHTASGSVSVDALLYRFDADFE
jgi:hypothetical protein